jgi:DNA-binding NtrC family response regulator
MTAARVLIVDSDRIVLESMAAFLGKAGIEPLTASSFHEANLKTHDRMPDLVVADVNLPDRDGFELLRHFREQAPDIAVILLTGYGTIEDAVEAIRLGAFDYLTKPVLPDELRAVIDRALGQRRLVVANRQIKQQIHERYGLENIVGNDYQMLQMYDVIESVAEARTTVLVTGESGTGKTMIARAIHRRSPRRDQPFVEVACGALPETLLESELFGHKAGSFTGAIGDKIGKFALADGGTIFLDEIATASPALQVKLLRVLQDMEFEPVGGTETKRVDARVILATNEDLAQLVARRQFRQDLYYRINVVSMHLPPLRERVGDIPLLATHFLKQFMQRTGRKLDGFSYEAMDLMQHYPWPGNIRELENVVERAVVLGKGPLVQPADLPGPLHKCQSGTIAPSAASVLKDQLQEPERRIIEQALEANGWNRQETALQLGINRTTLYKKMKRYGLERMRYVPRPV